MNYGPTIELLTATHQFPGKFVFKAIGQVQGDFADRVVAAIRAELQHDFDSPCELRQTTSGRHVSVTIEPWVQTPEEVLAIYNRLRVETGLVMLF